MSSYVGQLFPEEGATPRSNNVRDQMDHLAQASQGNWLPSETYVHGNRALHLDLWIRPRDGHGRVEHKIAALQRTPGVELTRLNGLDITNPANVDLERLGGSVDSGVRGQKGAMFVFVGELSETTQRMRSWAVHSTVWLAVVDEVHGSGVDSAQSRVPAFPFGMVPLSRGR